MRFGRRATQRYGPIPVAVAPTVVQFDAVGPSSTGQTSSSSTSLTWSHTASGVNRIVFVSVAYGVSADAGRTMSATYDGVAMTSLGLRHSNDGTAGFVQMWYLVNPPTGAKTVAVTAAGGTPTTLVGGSISFTNVHQTTPVGSLFSAASVGNSTNPTVTVTGTTSTSMVIDAVANGGGISFSNRTQRWLNNFSGATAAGNAAQSTASAPGGSIVMDYNTASDWWAMLAVEVKVAVPLSLSRDVADSARATDGTPMFAYNFEDGLSSWDSITGPAVNSAEQAHGGTRSLKFTTINDGSSFDGFYKATPDPVRVSGGVTIRATLWIYTTTASRKIWLSGEFYDGSNTSIGTVDGTAVPITASGAWVQHTITVNSPALAQEANLTFYVGTVSGSALTSGEVYYFDDIDIFSGGVSRSLAPSRAVIDQTSPEESDPLNRPAMATGDGWLSGITWQMDSVGLFSTSSGAIRRTRAVASSTSMYSEVVYAATDPGVSVLAGPTVNMPVTMGATSGTTGDFYIFGVANASLNGLTIRMKSNLSSSFTTLGTTVTFTVQIGDRLRLERSGTSLIASVIRAGSVVSTFTRDVSLAPLVNDSANVWTGAYENSPSIRYTNWAGGEFSEEVVTSNVVPSSGAQISRSAADTAAATDALTRALTQSRAVADSAPAVDTVARTSTRSRATSDTASATDTLARALVQARAPPDTAAATDTVARTRTSSRTAADTAAASDVVARSQTWSRATSDSAAATDTVSRASTRPRTAADSAPATDTVARTQSPQSRSISDSASATDVVARALTQARAASDSAPAADSVTARVATPRTVSDSAPAIDSVTRSQSPQSRSVSDSAPATDTAARSFTVSRPVADVSGATDAVARTSTRTRTVSDSGPASDAVTRARTSARTAADSAPATDTVARTQTPQARALSDSAPAADTIARTSTRTRTTSDSASASDTVTRARTSARAAADTASAADTVARSLTQARTVSDVALATDSARPTTFSVHVADSAPAVDTVARELVSTRKVVEGVNLVPWEAATFETSVSSFGAVSGVNVVRSTAQSDSGTASALLTVNAQAITDGYFEALASPRVTAPGGISYAFEIAVRLGTMPDIGASIDYFDSNGTSVGGKVFSQSGTPGSWQRFTTTEALPDYVASVQFRVYNLSAPTLGETVWLDSLGVYPTTLPGAWVSPPLPDVVARSLVLDRGVVDVSGPDIYYDVYPEHYGEVTDAVTRTLTETRSVSDSAPAVDTVETEFTSGTVSINRSVSDTAAATDTVARSQAPQSRAVTDSAPGTDTATRTQSPQSRTTSDSAPATDTVTRTSTRTRAAADNASATDTVTRSRTSTRAASDSAPATDTVTRTRTAPRAVSDSAPATDAVARTQAPQTRSVSDSAPATDTAVATGAGSSSATDSAPASDTASGRGTDTRATSDSAPATDAVTRSRTSPRTAADTAPAVDTQTKTQSFTRATADSAPATDTVVRQSSRPRAVADAAAASDTVARSLVLARTVSDTAVANDDKLANTQLLRVATDVAGATDVVTRTSSRSRSAADTAGATDTTSSHVVLARTVSDSAPAVDTVVYSGIGTASVLDYAPAVDTVLGRRRYFVRVETVLVAGNWTPNTGTIPDALNNKSESDYIYSTDAAPYARLKLGSAATPNSGQRWWRARLGNVTDGTATYTITLLEGGGSTLGAGTVKGTLSTTRSTQGAVTLEVEITDPITNYSDLYAEIKAEV